jgi:hypothetical protein
MRHLAILALSLSVSCGGCATSNAVRVPDVGMVVPEAGAESALGKCGDLLGMQSKWAQALRIQDWKIQMVCADIPDSENAWALSYVEPATREIGAVIDPDAPDLELTVLHELAHAVLSYVRAADSELVEENAVRTLSEQMLCRPFVEEK